MGKARAWASATLICVAFGGYGCADGVDERAAERTEHALGIRSATPILAAARPPQIDGVPDWQYARVPALRLDRLIRGERGSDEGLSAQFRALHDHAALYVLVEVRDDQVVVDAPPDAPWEDDAVELFVDGDGRGGDGYDDDDVQLIVRPGERQVYVGERSGPIDPTQVAVVTQRVPGGYRVELALPWAALGSSWQPGKTLGLDVQVDDDDDGGPRDRKLAWAAGDDEAWQLASRFGRVRLLPPRKHPGRVSGVGDLVGGAVSSAVTGLSASGEVAVGLSEGAHGIEAFRWTRATGIRGLGGAPSRAFSISPNGKVVAGLATRASEAGQVAGLWRESAPFEVLRGGPQTGPVALFRMVEPHVVRDDGRVWGRCTQYGLGYPVGGCRQDAQEQITFLQSSSILFAADDAGHTGGAHVPLRGEPIGTLATLDGASLGYPTPYACVVPHACRSEVRAFSEGAAVAVGTAAVPVPPPEGVQGPPSDVEPLREVAFVYTASDGIAPLPDLPEGETASGAYAVSADGRTIVGFGSDATGRQAVVWRDRVPTRLVDLLRASGSDLPDGWQLREIRGVSSDGQTFAGNGTRPGGAAEGFWVSLAESGQETEPGAID